MENIIKFPVKMCSVLECEEKATKNLELIDGDNPECKFKKYFCETHYKEVTE